MMSEIIKWSETNVGKYSMFNIELGGIKTEISCDSENSEKLISLLKDLSKPRYGSLSTTSIVEF